MVLFCLFFLQAKIDVNKIPEELGKLTALKELYLSNNELSGETEKVVLEFRRCVAPTRR